MFRPQRKIPTVTGKSEVLGGVFLTTSSCCSSEEESLTSWPLHPVLSFDPPGVELVLDNPKAGMLHKQESCGTFSTTDTTDFDETSYAECDGDTTEENNSNSWTSSGSPSHHVGAPLLVRSAISQRHLGKSALLSDEEVLGRIMLKSRHLPRTRDGYFTSNHIMINDERTKRTMVPLKRSRILDEIAREHATKMAQKDSLFHADPKDLQVGKHIGMEKRVGSNVGKRPSIQNIHSHMITNSE